MPILKTLASYTKSEFSADLVAGLIVAIMLVPQGMAYALLAGLPAQHGLYASMLPLFLYGLFGTSRYLAVGPVAIVSLLTSAVLSTLATPESTAYVSLAITLALMVAVIQITLGVLRIGFLVNFLSHPVLVGFSAAAAIVIGFSQVKHVLGVSVARTAHFYTDVAAVWQQLGNLNGTTLLMGTGGVVLLIYFKTLLKKHLLRLGVPETVATLSAKIGPLLVVLIGATLTATLALDTTANVAIIGPVPAGLPVLTLPSVDYATLRSLFPTAMAISFVGYMESISVAKSLASRKREKIGANMELFALGIANLGAAFTGGYPVTGGFSRSLVNYSAGARSTVASLITALLLTVAVVFLTPLFVYIPKAALAAIILVAVAGLIDLNAIRHVWTYDKRDALALVTSFFAVLFLGIETGILVGAALSLFLIIWRTSQPHVAVLGKLPTADIYRNVKRHTVQTWPEIALVRIDASLYFANTNHLEQTIAETVVAQPTLAHLVLVGTAINDVDYSALEALEGILHSLQDAKIALHLAAFKGPVLDKLAKSGFLTHLGASHIHLTTHAAMQQLGVAQRTNV